VQKDLLQMMMKKHQKLINKRKNIKNKKRLRISNKDQTL